MKLALVMFVIGHALAAFGANTNFTWQAGLAFKETYDDNVFILNTPPNPAIVPPPNSVIAVPKKDSFVSTLTPSANLSWRAGSAFNAFVSYAPDFTWYHSASSEDYIAHRGAINFNGRIKEATYDWLNSVCWIDGNHLGPTTIRPGDCRAIGGIPLRDRRDAAIYRDGFKLTVPAGKWFVRPVVNAYVHDFQTEQRANTNTAQYIYENYIDRWDLGGGVDAGYEAFDKTKIVAGYRYGYQHQGDLVGVHSQYNSYYQRVLFGVEGAPATWLKLSVTAGPEWRDWPDILASNTNFDQNEVLCYVDASATILPSKADTITLRISRFEQPAFTSQSVYEDIKYEIGWRHKFTDKFTVGAGFLLYIGDWQQPVNRDDWIYTASAMATYAFDKHISAELSYSYDSAVNQVSTSLPGATYANGREYTRNLVTLGMKYSF